MVPFRLSRRAGVALLVAVTCAMPVGASYASAQDPVGATTDCAGNAGTYAPGTVQWYEQDQDNRYCATQGTQDTLNNPAYFQAQSETQAAADAAGAGGYGGDPFRFAPTRWNGIRGKWTAVSFKNASGTAQYGSIYTPMAGCTTANGSCPDGLRTAAAPWPGILVIAELPGPVTQGAGANLGGEYGDSWDWAIEPLAEQGYMVFAAPVSGDGVVQDALNWFLSTPSHPDTDYPGHSQYNPLYQQLDHAHVGIAGHSGGGSSAEAVGQADPRISAVVAWDRARSGGLPNVRWHAPTININADYTGSTSAPGLSLLEPRSGYPEIPAGSRWTDCQALQRERVDCMVITMRAAQHWDFSPFVADHSRYGTMVATYYTLAWFDRYLRGATDTTRSSAAPARRCSARPSRARGATRGSRRGRRRTARRWTNRCGRTAAAPAAPPALASDALGRLTASRFDDSTDVHSIGTGFYDPYQAEVACGVDGSTNPSGDCLEAGNVPIKLHNLNVADRLSFWYPSYYWLNGGAVQCGDMRDGFYNQFQGCNTHWPPLGG